MALISKYENQTVFDLLLIHSGAISGLFEFLEANSLTEIEIPEGNYFAPEVLKPEVVAYFKSKNNEVSILTGSGSVPHVAPSIVTLNGDPFNVYYGGTENDIQLLDQDDNLIIPISVVGDVVKVNVPTSTPAWWTRNPYWVQTPEVNEGDDVFYGVVAVYEDIPDFNSVYLGGFTVLDWGDGTSGGTSHAYNYATLTSTVIVDKNGRNYKTALVHGVTSTDHLNLKAVVNNQYFYNWLEIIADIPNTNTVNLSSFFSGNNACYLPLLERVTLTNTGNFTTCTFGMDQMQSLKVFDVDLTNLTTAGYFLFNCSEVRNLDGSVINWNLPNCTVFNSSFNFSPSSLGLITIPNAPNLTSLLRDVKTLLDVKIITSPALTDLTAFGFNSFIRSLEISDCSNVTGVSLFLTNCSYLQRLILTGMRTGFSVSGQMMSATALNDMFTSLGIASGSQTINVSNNKGSATCDTTIATAKGFTVIV